MKYYKITKYFQGGYSLFWASHPKSYRVKRKSWETQLDEWGEGTAGGHNYGYHIYIKGVKARPYKARMFKKLVPIKARLKFHKDFLEKVKTCKS